MKTFRRFCIVLVLLGLVLSLGGRDDLPAFDTVPFPGAGLSVKMNADVAVAGDYRVNVSMPRAEQTLGLASETIPCSLVVNLAGQHRDVASLTRHSEYGFAGIQYYGSEEVWHLGPGRCTAEISSRQGCAVAASRGAAITFEHMTTRPTERHLLRWLRTWSGGLFLAAGLLGVIAGEFRRA